MKEKIENNSNKAIEELKEFINNNEVQNISVFTAKKILSELETYKKIVPFMADFINMYTLSGEENQYCHRVVDCQEIGGSRSCIECIIDWARKEVENENKNKK